MLVLSLLLTTVASFEIATMSADPTVRGSEVWLMTLDAKSCVKLSQKDGFTGPVWTDRNHVAWVEGSRERQELWVAELPSLARKRLLAAPDVYIDRDGVIQIAERMFRISGERLTQIPRPERGEQASLVRDKGKLTVVWRQQRYRVSNPKARWKVKGLEITENSVAALEALGPPYWTRNVSVDGATILLMSYAPTAQDSVELLVKLDAKAKTAFALPIDAEHIKFDGRGRFIALSGRRMERRGKAELWSSDVFVGDARTLRYHKLNLPMSFTAEASLRP